MRKLLLSMLFLVTSVCFATDYQLNWIVVGGGIYTQFSTRIVTSQLAQYITSVYPQGFSFSQIKSGIMSREYDARFLQNASHPVIITPYIGNMIYMGYGRTSVPAHSLLSLFVNALRTYQGQQQIVYLREMTIALSLFPLLTLPDGGFVLEQSVSNGFVVNGNMAYGDFYSYGNSPIYDKNSPIKNNYGIVLQQGSGGFQMTLIFDPIGSRDVMQVMTAISNGSYNGAFISGFIHDQIMDVLITPPQGSATTTSLAAQGVVAGVMAAATLTQSR